MISLKFGMWSAEGGGNLHSKICLVSSRQHRATEVRKLRFLSSCQYTHGVARRLLGPHDTLPCVLILVKTPPQVQYGKKIGQGHGQETNTQRRLLYSAQDQARVLFFHAAKVWWFLTVLKCSLFGAFVLGT